MNTDQGKRFEPEPQALEAAGFTVKAVARMRGTRAAESKINRVFKRMPVEEVNELAPDKGEFPVIAEAVMAWYQMLFASKIFRSDQRKAVMESLAGSLVVLGSLVKYAYALGRRTGKREAQRGAIGPVRKQHKRD